MTVQINYKNSILKKVPSNHILFVDERFNINGIKKHISNSEFLYISDLLKNSDLKKDLLVFEINSKKTIFLVSIKKNIKISDITETEGLLNFTSALQRGELAASAELSWKGNPTDIDPKIIEGQMIFQNGSGRFVQEQDQPVLKFLSSFHVPSLFRRVLGKEETDESDQGFNFTDLKGTITLEKGKVSIEEPLIVRASGGKFKFGGFIDWERDLVDTDLIVTLPVGNTFPWAGLVIGGPLSMAGVLATQKFLFEDRFDQLSSAKYKISGRLHSPDFEFISIFNDDVRDGRN